VKRCALFVGIHRTNQCSVEWKISQKSCLSNYHIACYKPIRTLLTEHRKRVRESGQSCVESVHLSLARSTCLLEPVAASVGSLAPSSHTLAPEPRHASSPSEASLLLCIEARAIAPFRRGSGNSRMTNECVNK
jgi:hypothetical protein